MSFQRMIFLAPWLLAITLLGGCGDSDSNSTATPTAQVQSAAKNVILVIGDGMQEESERAGSLYLTGASRGLTFHALPVQGFVTTWDVTTYDRYAWDLGMAQYTPDTFRPVVGYDSNRGGTMPYPEVAWGDDNYFLTQLNAWGGTGPKEPATDSASAGTAMATGIKTDDGNIAWRSGDPADGALETIAEKMRAQKGAAIGVVSTVQFSHATPATFVSHNVNRNNYGEIAAEIINTVKPEVVIGGGHPDWKSGNIDPADYAALVDGSAGYTLVERTVGVDGGTALLAAAATLPANGRLFGLFGGSGGNFEYPVPTTDGSAVVHRGSIENPTLAQASEAALQVLARDPDGFFLMVEQGDIDWANHANNYTDMIGTIDDLDKAVARIIAFVDQPGDDIDWSNTLFIATTDHGNSYLRLLDEAALRNGQIPADLTGIVSYGTGNHTNELVNYYSRGAGSELFADFTGEWYPGTRIIDNTRIHTVMQQAVGVQ